MSRKVLPFAPSARFCAYYILVDDFLWNEAFMLWPGSLLEIAWSSFRPGELHAIELVDGRVILRCIRSVISTVQGLAFEIHGGDADLRELLSLVLVKRTGRVRRVFYVQGEHAREIPAHSLKALLAAG